MFAGLGNRNDEGPPKLTRRQPVADSVPGEDLHPDQIDGKLKWKGACEKVCNGFILQAWWFS